MQVLDCELLMWTCKLFWHQDFVLCPPCIFPEKLCCILQGFDDDLQDMVQRQEPVCRQVIPRLTAGAIGVLQDVLEAFPNEPEMRGHHLLKFAQAVKDLNRSM